MMNNGSKAAAAGGGGFFLGLVTGLLVGGIAVMLYAPKSGPETRGLLKDEVAKTQQMLQCWANDIRARADEFSQIVRFRAGQETMSGGNGRDTHEL